jgi:hypothetical protein
MNLFRNVLDTCCKEAHCENASQFAAQAVDGALEYIISGRCTTKAFPLFLDVIARVTTGRSEEQSAVGASSGLEFLTEFSHGKVFAAISDVMAQRFATGGTNE